MKVFLSWSGEKSRAVAEALRGWLPSVIQEVDPFMSSEDIAAGARWQYLISEALEGSSFGVLCVTRENQSAPWLNFEAGAIAKQVESSRVVPLAIDLSVADVKPPLGHFQAKELTQRGILSVLESINDVSTKPLPNLAEVCDVWWPKLEPMLDAAPDESVTTPVRTDREVLEEILATVRLGQTRKNDASLAAPGAGLRWGPLFLGSGRPLTPEERDRIELQRVLSELLPDDAQVFLGDTRAGQDVPVVIQMQDEPPAEIRELIEMCAAAFGRRVRYVAD